MPPSPTVPTAPRVRVPAPRRGWLAVPAAALVGLTLGRGPSAGAPAPAQVPAQVGRGDALAILVLELAERGAGVPGGARAGAPAAPSSVASALPVPGLATAELVAEAATVALKVDAAVGEAAVGDAAVGDAAAGDAADAAGVVTAPADLTPADAAPLASTVAPAGEPLDRGLAARLLGRPPTAEEAALLAALAAPARAGWLLAREEVHARALRLELEHLGLAPDAAAWAGAPGDLLAGRRALLAVVRDAVTSLDFARRHLGGLALGAAVVDRALAAPGLAPPSGLDAFAAQRAAEGHAAVLLGRAVRTAREVVVVLAASPAFEAALRARVTARVLGRPATAAELAAVEAAGPAGWLARAAALACGPAAGGAP